MRDSPVNTLPYFTFMYLSMLAQLAPFTGALVAVMASFTMSNYGGCWGAALAFAQH